jgi:hypothetical protein
LFSLFFNDKLWKAWHLLVLNSDGNGTHFNCYILILNDYLDVQQGVKLLDDFKYERTS